MSAPWLTRSASVSPQMKQSEVPESVKALVRERSGGACECCGIHLRAGWRSFHHRRPSGMGGSTDAAQHTVQNVVWLCGRDNRTGCHGDVHQNPLQSKPLGWLVHRGADPSRIPVLLHDGRLAFLTSYGQYEVLPEGETA